MQTITRIVLILASWAIVQSNANAHEAFKDPLEERYGLKSVSCKACHPNNKDKSINNKFGNYFAEEFKGKDITRKFKEAESIGDEAVKEYEKEMVEHFLAALKVVEKKKITFEELIQAGLLNGTRVETK